jgi:ribonucleoside-diphosphate reductase beta chain
MNGSTMDLSGVDPKSLINTGQVGLLSASGTYDVDRYPWAYEFWKRQQQTHWMGEEVPLGADIKDWTSDRVTGPERALLTQIFRFFTQSDVEVGDNYWKRYIPLFQPLELQMMMAAFSNMETVHIDAYALLLKTLGMPKAEFEAFRDYGEMRAKADYMHTFGTATVGDVSRTLAMFGAFTEGMALFASFAMLLNFPRHNKMNGMGQIVSWSVRDESLHCEGIIRLFHEWNRETGALTKAVRDDTLCRPIDFTSVVVLRPIDAAREGSGRRQSVMPRFTVSDLGETLATAKRFRFPVLDLREARGRPSSFLTVDPNGVIIEIVAAYDPGELHERLR